MVLNVDAAPDESSVELWDLNLDVLTLDSPPHAASPSPASPSLAAANVATAPVMPPLPKDGNEDDAMAADSTSRRDLFPPRSRFSAAAKMWEQDVFPDWLEAALSRPPPILAPPSSAHPSIRDGTIFWCDSNGHCGWEGVAMQLGLTVMELRMIIWKIADEHTRRLICPDGEVSKGETW